MCGTETWEQEPGLTVTLAQEQVTGIEGVSQTCAASNWTPGTLEGSKGITHRLPSDGVWRAGSGHGRWH